MLSIEAFSALLKATPQIKKALAAKGVILDELDAEADGSAEEELALKGNQKTKTRERKKPQKANIETTSDEDDY